MNIKKVNLDWNGNLRDLNLDNIDGIVFHHMAHESADIQEVHRWHRDGNGWVGIGYNFWGNKKGEGFIARGWKQGAHASGHNATKVGVGLQGNFQAKDSMTDEQVQFCIDVAKHIYDVIGREVPVMGHDEVGNTACPGRYFRMEEIKAGIKGESAKQTSSGSSGSSSWSSLSNSDKYKEAEKVIRDAGLTVRQFQNLLLAVGEKLPRFGADGHFGAETLAATEDFQSRHNISSSSQNFFGRPGPQTVRELRKIVKYPGVLRANQPYPSGTAVRQLQRVLDQESRGQYGPNTAGLVRTYQQANNLQVDGVTGPETWGHVFG